MPGQFLPSLDARDRALMLRCVMSPDAPPSTRRFWLATTHLGGAASSLAAAGLPWFACCELHDASRLALIAVVVSHLIVQLVKRTVVRGRPVPGDRGLIIALPDRFSFPSGHATAVMSLALVYGSAFPLWAGPLLALALLVGFSRIRLGVHYPSDVLAGQVIAAATTGALLLA
jgi:undecaprenyl-diphosphatase